MDLGVVIVNWNSGDLLARLVHSLAPLQDELKEVLIIDNASQDWSLPLRGLHPKVQVLFLKRNQGFAGAANEGMSRATSKVVLLLNPDVEVKPTSIRELYLRIQESPKAAIVCGPLVNKNGSAQESSRIRSFPTWRSVLRDVLFLDEVVEWLGKGTEPPITRLRELSLQSRRPGPLKIDQPAAAFWLLRKEAWKAIGGFDPRFYPAWFEDVDFCKRLRQGDWQVLYFPNFPVIHRGGLALKRLGYTAFVEICYRNLLFYWKKHHFHSYFLLWFPVKFGTWIRRHFIRR